MKNIDKTANYTHILAFFAALRGNFPVFLFTQSRQDAECLLENISHKAAKTQRWCFGIHLLFSFIIYYFQFIFLE